MKKAYAVLALVAALALAAGAVAATAAPESAGSRAPKLQRALDDLVAAGVPGAILLVREGNRTTRLTSGYGNLATRTRMRAGDRFRVGSVTKTFVATVVLQLVGEGKVSLDDTVERWLPGVVPDGQAITVRRLLNMTGGLFDYLNDGDTTVTDRQESGDWTYRWSPLELVAIATAHEPKFAPGAGWSYCNTCYVLLGLIIERATGRSIEAELRSRIFVPLRLRATTFDSGPRISGRHAHGYLLLDRPPLLDVTGVSPSFGWAAGAIVSTADDVARFYRALLGGRLLSRGLLRAMQTLVRPPGAGNAGYGFGIFTHPLPCGFAWGHNGGIPGYSTWAMNRKDGKRQVVLVSTLDDTSRSRRALQAEVRVLATAYCG